MKTYTITVNGTAYDVTVEEGTEPLLRQPLRKQHRRLLPRLLRKQHRRLPQEQVL